MGGTLVLSAGGDRLRCCSHACAQLQLRRHRNKHPKHPLGWGLSVTQQDAFPSVSRCKNRCSKLQQMKLEQGMALSQGKNFLLKITPRGYRFPHPGCSVWFLTHRWGDGAHKHPRRGGSKVGVASRTLRVLPRAAVLGPAAAPARTHGCSLAQAGLSPVNQNPVKLQQPGRK